MDMPLFSINTGESSKSAVLDGLPEIHKGPLKCIYFNKPSFHVHSFLRTVEIDAQTGEELGPWKD